MCTHIVTRGRKGEKGWWCVNCGEKAMMVDPRPCGDCKHVKELQQGYVMCDKLRMRITREMHVTYIVKDGTCWENQEAP